MKSGLAPHDWMVIAIALAGIGAALVAFLRTPPERRYTVASPPPAKEEGVEYAEEYTGPERLMLLLKGLAIAVPLFVAFQYWFMPWLVAFAKVSHCHQYLGQSGTAWVMYGVFVGPIVLFALLVGLPGVRGGLRVLRDGQYPPKGAKVFRRTRIRTGRAAKRMACARMVPLIASLCLAIWSVNLCQHFLATLDLSTRNGCEHLPESEKPAA